MPSRSKGVIFSVGEVRKVLLRFGKEGSETDSNEINFLNPKLFGIPDFEFLHRYAILPIVLSNLYCRQSNMWVFHLVKADINMNSGFS